MFSSLKSLVITGLASSGLGLTAFAMTLPISTPSAYAGETEYRNYWSSPQFIEGRGVDNCGAPRIQQDVQNRCQQRVSDDPEIVRLKDVEWYDASRTNSKSWDGKRSCVYRATYRCNFVKEKEK
jgi:hypothetical protein